MQKSAATAAPLTNRAKACALRRLAPCGSKALRARIARRLRGDQFELLDGVSNKTAADYCPRLFCGAPMQFISELSPVAVIVVSSDIDTVCVPSL